MGSAPLHCSCWERMREVSRNGFAIGVNAAHVNPAAFRVTCTDCATVYSMLPVSPVAVESAARYRARTAHPVAA